MRIDVSGGKGPHENKHIQQFSSYDWNDYWCVSSIQEKKNMYMINKVVSMRAPNPTVTKREDPHKHR